MNTDESKVTSKLFLAKNLNFTEGKLEKLELFANQVLSFNKRYNLISKNSEKNIWHRHILDSAQLIKHIDYKNFKSLSDLGTGAGFPGIILSIFYNDIRYFWHAGCMPDFKLSIFSLECRYFWHAGCMPDS